MISSLCKKKRKPSLNKIAEYMDKKDLGIMISEEERNTVGEYVEDRLDNFYGEYLI